MAKPADVTSALHFDVSRGALFVSAPKGENGENGAPRERAAVLPIEALAELVTAAGPVAAAAAARQIGASMGARVAHRIGDVRAASLDAVTNALAAEVSIAGFGRVALERWGRALVLAVEHAPEIDAPFLSAMLEAMIDAAALGPSASGPQLASIVLDESDGLRVLITSARAVARVRTWLTDGLGWRHALARLQERRRT